VKSGVYDRVVITRAPVPAGEDIGFLPGTSDEKMEPWIAPIKEHIDYMLRHGNQPQDDAGAAGDTGAKKKKPQRPASDGSGKKMSPFDKLVDEGIIEIIPGAFVRGRSFERTLVIIDEAQNLKTEEGKTWITRIGNGSKIVLLGDVEQVDRHYLRSGNNALAVASFKSLGQPFAATVHLLLGVRSELADWAANNL
jgi:PhoH-like ATPase